MTYVVATLDEYEFLADGAVRVHGDTHTIYHLSFAEQHTQSKLFKKLNAIKQKLKDDAIQLTLSKVARQLERLNKEVK